MTKRFTSAGAMLAMRAVTGDYFLALGRGENPTGLLDEATVGGYARQPVTIVARRAVGTNAGPVRFGAFAAGAGSYSHAGLYTAARGGTCIWVGPLAEAVTLIAGGSVSIPANTLSLQVARVDAGGPAVLVPANTALPLIAGTPREGELLTASPGTWSGTAPLTYAFQWQRGITAISGATAATYTARVADVGQTLRVVVTATNVAGAAQATSASTAPVAAALIPPANTSPPVISGPTQEGEVLTASTGTWSGTAPIAYAFQWQRGATPIAGATAASYTAQSADVGRTLRVIVTATNSAGTMEAASASTAQVAAAPLPGITIVTPVGPLAASEQLDVSGSFSGTMTAASLVWEQNGNAVGQPIAITSFAEGAWTATIAAPEVAGVYRLRATFNGTGPTATSDDVTIGTSDQMNLATFTFDGSGDAADTVVVFGHSFPAGALHPTASIVLRRADNNAALRTQMTPLATWPDGTVRTAAFAGELPALANGALLQVRLRRDEAHTSPGPTLSWSGALSGRSIRIRTWAPGNTTTPLWSYDVGAALLASTDDWMSGPLAVTRRAETLVPATATQDVVSGNGPDVLRLHVDVTATKDGMILVDWAWNNAAMHQAGGKIARFGYTVEVDGVIIYDQRPATGAARDLLQYCWWMNRRAKKGATVYDFHTTFRPLFRPDYQTLVDSKFLLPYTRESEIFNTNAGVSGVTDNRTNGASQLTNPYWPWGLTRDAGTPGGRQEIGYQTVANFVWAVTQGSRWGELSAHWQAQAFAAASWITWDHAENRTAHSDQWRRLTLGSNGGGQAVTTRELATEHPTGQIRTRNATDHLTADQAHRGAFYGMVALLSGRRLFYDLQAARAAEAGMNIDRWNGVTLFSYISGPNWRNTAPDAATGLSWAPQPWQQQSRSTGWQIRDIVEADYLIPDSFPRRSYYTQNVEAWLNAFNAARPVIQAYMGGHDEFGWFAVHAGDTWKISLYMFAFWNYGLTTMARLGYPGAQTLLQGVAKARSGAVLHSDKRARWNISGTDQWMFDITSGTGLARPPWQNWTEVDADPQNGTFFADWTAFRPVTPTLGYPDGSDYYLNQLNTTALQAAYVTDPAQRAATRDVLVRYRSERTFNRGGDGFHPRVRPSDFLNAGQAHTNLVMPNGWDWRTSVAPTLLTPAAMTIDLDAAAGTLVGFVEWTGPVPRCTTASNANNDAFEIVSQPAGNPFTISRGGVIRRSGTGTLTPGPVTLRVRARVVDGNAPLGETEVTRWSNTVTVTVNAT